MEPKLRASSSECQSSSKQRRSLPKLRTISRRWENGTIGVWQKLKDLRRIKQFQSPRPWVRALAFRVIRAANVQNRDYEAYARVLLEYVQSYFYAREIGEQIWLPWKTVEVGGGDCDCLSLLYACLCESVGIPVRFRAIKHLGKWVHVFPEVGLPPRAPEKWLAAETTKKVPLGWIPNVKKRLTRNPARN